MRKLAIIAVLASVLAATVGSAAASAATPLRGTLEVRFPKGNPATNAPCPEEVFRGVGSLAGCGPATISILEEEL